jgi:hypothetical protein
MKKTMSALGAIFTAAALFLTGCESPAMPDPIAAANNELSNTGRTIRTDSDGLNTGSDPAALKTIANISASALPSESVSNVEGAEFLITFNLNGSGTDYVSPDEDALEKSLEIVEVMPKTIPTDTFTVNSERNGTNLLMKVVSVKKNSSSNNPEARIRANLSRLSNNAVKVRIKAGTFTANGGRYKLDLDNDLTPGESNGDDDLFCFLQSIASIPNTSLAPITSVVPPNPRATIPLPTATFNGTGSPSTLFNQITVTFSGNNLYLQENYSDHLNRYIKIDKYNPTRGDWDLAAVACTSEFIKGSTASGDHTYSASFTPEDGAVLRARIEGLRDLKTTSEYYGFRQRYAMGDNAANEAMISGSTPTISYDGSKYTNSSIASSSATLVSSNNRNVSVKILLNTAPTGTNKETPGSVNQDTIKIIGTKTAESNTIYVDVRWESSSYEYAYDPSSGKNYPMALLLKLPESHKLGTSPNNISYKVYITPQVTVGTLKALPASTTIFHTYGVFNGVAEEITGIGSL